MAGFRDLMGVGVARRERVYAGLRDLRRLVPGCGGAAGGVPDLRGRPPVGSRGRATVDDARRRPRRSRRGRPGARRRARPARDRPRAVVCDRPAHAPRLDGRRQRAVGHDPRGPRRGARGRAAPRRRRRDRDLAPALLRRCERLERRARGRPGAPPRRRRRVGHPPRSGDRAVGGRASAASPEA